jgi:phosphatidylglycerol---prolipoprotein diacylglyceryl transferase
MRPIPVVFHIGSLQLHTYGFGLAITFWFAYSYFRRRLQARGLATDWLPRLFFWVIIAAVVGARVMHVVATFRTYETDPGTVFAIWDGGLSSFGGLILAVPTGILIARRRCPELSLGAALDIVAPVLAAAWAVGRLLGPQLMVAGGGHATHQWFGMYYATQKGKRLPVPIFQAMEDTTVYLSVLWVEHRCRWWPDRTVRAGYPAGAVIGTGMVLWGIERTLDEKLWLAYPGHIGDVLVEAAGLALVVGGAVLLAVTRQRWQAWLANGAPGGHPDPVELSAVGRDQATPVGSSPAAG